MLQSIIASPSQPTRQRLGGHLPAACIQHQHSGLRPPALFAQPLEERALAAEGFRAASHNPSAPFQIAANESLVAVLLSCPAADMGQCHLHAEENTAKLLLEAGLLRKVNRLKICRICPILGISTSCCMRFHISPMPIPQLICK